MSMGGSSTPSTQTVTQKTEIPQYLQDAGLSNVNTATDIAARPYTTYTGQQVADLTPAQTTALDQVATNDTGSPLAGTYDSAIDRTSKTLEPSAVKDWMSPYVDQALTPTLRSIYQKGDAAAKVIDTKATGAGAFGDARTGVEQGENTRNTATLAADATATGYDKAYNNAVLAAGAAYTDNLTGALDTSKIATDKSKYLTDTTNDLLAAGKVQQTQDQSGLTTAYNDYLNQLNYPIEMLNVKESAATNTPYSTTRLTTTPYSPTAQALGAASALYGLAGKTSTAIA